MTSGGSLFPFRLLSVIVPAYNEERVIAATLLRIGEYLRSGGREGEVIVVDDGSTDGTRAAAEGAGDAVPHLQVLGHRPNRGKGYAVSRGVEAARGDWVLFMDADLSADISQVERFTGSVREGCDAVIGSRYIPESTILAPQSGPRRLAGRVFRAIVHGALIGEYTDLTCGFKLFRASVARDLFGKLSVDGWSFDVELLLLLRQSGYRCAEVPIEWSDRKRKRLPSPGDFADAFGGLAGIMAKKLTGRYRPALRRP